MGQLFKLMTSAAWLLLVAVLAVQPANAQKRYPAYEDAWDATDYRALVERIETSGLELPTLSGEAEVFERLVASDNIPLHMGTNTELAITVRFQKLEPILRPLHQLIVLYSNEAQKGKPYATEIARLRVYESRATAALLEISDPYLATYKMDPRYQTHVSIHKEMKNEARQLYSVMVKSMADTNLYSKSDILVMSKGALNALSSYHRIFTDKDRQDLSNALGQQISKTSDQELKRALSDLREAIKNGQVPT